MPLNQQYLIIINDASTKSQPRASSRHAAMPCIVLRTLCGHRPFGGHLQKNSAAGTCYDILSAENSAALYDILQKGCEEDWTLPAAYFAGCLFRSYERWPHTMHSRRRWIYCTSLNNSLSGISLFLQLVVQLFWGHLFNPWLLLFSVFNFCMGWEYARLSHTHTINC